MEKLYNAIDNVYHLKIKPSGLFLWHFGAARRIMSMPYHLTPADIAPPVRLTHGLGASPWLRAQLREELGRCFVDSATLDDGLSLVYAHYAPARELRETSALQRERAALTITVALEGRSSTLDMDGQRFDFIAGHSTLAAFASVRGERRFPAHHAIRQLRLIAEEPLLHKYGLDNLPRSVPHDHATRLACTRYTAATQRLADALIHLHDRAGNLLDLQIAALSLLSEQTRHLLPTPTARAAALRAQDQDKMLRARDILMQQFDRPLTLAYLCMAVGTNEYKLKQGFRALFGTSVYRMLTDVRMQKARELLETGLNVSTVAYRVGYQHPASFSTAFAQYYGRAPKSVAGR